MRKEEKRGNRNRERETEELERNKERMKELEELDFRSYSLALIELLPPLCYGFMFSEMAIFSLAFSRSRLLFLIWSTQFRVQI